MPTFEVVSPDGTKYRVNAPEGASQDDAIAYVQRNFSAQKAPAAEKQAEPFGKQLSNELGAIPRQLGLTARAGFEGVGDTLDFLASPIRAGLNLIPGANFKPGALSTLSDAIGLPKPETTAEKVVNTGARMMVPAGGFVAGGKAMERLSGVPGAVGGLLAANPSAQLSSAAGGGLLGEYTKETGGDGAAQFVAALAGGLLAPAGLSAAKAIPGAIGRSAKNAVEYLAPGVTVSPQTNVNVTISNVLKNSGVDFAKLPQSVQASIRDDVANAMKISGELSQDALRRLVDYRLVGATPRTGNLTLDPVTLTQQKNLAKQGANLSDPAAQLLARAENENNLKLIAGLNDAGAAKGDALSAGSSVISHILGKDAAMQESERALYAAARDAAGRQIPLDRGAFVSDVYKRLAESNKGAFLPDSIANLINDIHAGTVTRGGNKFDVPFNVDVIDNLKTTLATASRGTQDGNTRAAIKAVREALENTPVEAVGRNVGGGQVVDPAVMSRMQGAANGMSSDALSAFDAARAAARQRRVWQESSPAVEAIINGAEPDRFIEQFVIGQGGKSSINSVAQLRDEIGTNPELINNVKGAIAQWLKSKALNGSADEVGRFSQSAYNKALNQIGDQKLSMFFTPEEVANIRAIGRVASYEQFQPVGSAVNNSNTSAGIAGMLDRIANSPVLAKLPLGRVFAEPIGNIAIGMNAKNATNVPRGLILNQPPKQKGLLPVSPALGLLGFSSE